MRIAHLADIHVQDRRRAEYAVVFESLYESLKSVKTRDGLDVIAVVGDIFDNKMRASAHNLEDVADFLSRLADIAPVVVITGNHDTNCLTPGALDLLTPLLADRQSLQPPRLTYWRNSGVYAAHGAVWVVAATDGLVPVVAEVEASVASLEERELIAHDAPRICLFHNEVRGARLPGGVTLANGQEDLAVGALERLPGGAIMPSELAQFDVSLGGHIHLRQMLTPRAAYCGSLVQQNIGESHLGHGYMIWTIQQSTACRPLRTALPKIQMVDLYNTKGFLRIELDQHGNDITARPLPTAPLYWEVVLVKGTPQTVVDNIIAQYTTQFNSYPRARRVINSEANKASSETLDASAAATLASNAAATLGSFDAAQEAASSIQAHEKIIRDLLVGEGSSLVEAVLERHRSSTLIAPTVRGARIRLVRFEFDNMYAFGPGNVIDFTRLEGAIAGVVAPNHAGKSSLIEALLFALFEAHPRATTKAELIHAGTATCHMALDFEVDGRSARIEKICTRSHAQASKYRFWVDGEERTGGGTPETLKEIAMIVGDAPAALASSFQLQSASADGAGFIAARPAERKRILASALSLGDFTALERETAKELTTLNGAIRALENGADLETLRKELAEAETEAKLAQAKAAELEPLVLETQEESSERHKESGMAMAELKVAEDACTRQITNLHSLLTRLGQKDIETAMAAVDADAAEWAKRLNIVQTTIKLPTLRQPLLTSAPSVATVAAAEAYSLKLRPGADLYKLQDELIAKSAATFGDSAKLERLEINLKATLANPVDVEAAHQEVAMAEKSLNDLRISWAYSSIREELSKVAKDGCSGCQHIKSMCTGSEVTSEMYEEARQRHIKAADALQTAQAAAAAQTAAAAQLMRLQNAKNAAASLAELREHINVLEQMQNITKESTKAYEAARLAASAKSQLELAKLSAATALYAAKSASQRSAAVTASQHREFSAAAAATARIAAASTNLKSEEKRSTTLGTAVRQREILKAYRNVLRPNGGIADKLLECARVAVQTHINEALIELGAKFSTEITPEFEIMQANQDDTLPTPKTWLSVGLASGYQRFVLSLAARLAIWRLATSPRIDALVIDEGFGACDEEYLVGLSGALEALATAPSAPRLIFIVSHVDMLKDRVEHALEIRHTQFGSQVRNVALPQNELACTIQPAGDKKVHCDVCDRSFNIGAMPRHLASALHATAVKREAKKLDKNRV